MTSLVKKVDEATVKNKSKDMGSFVIILDKSDETEKKVKAFAEKNGVKEVVLALDNPAGPKGYNIARDANVTVLLYVERKVKANFSFEKGKMTAADVDKVMKELPKILDRDRKVVLQVERGDQNLTLTYKIQTYTIKKPRKAVAKKAVSPKKKAATTKRKVAAKVKETAKKKKRPH